MYICIFLLASLIYCCTNNELVNLSVNYCAESQIVHKVVATFCKDGVCKHDCFLRSRLVRWLSNKLKLKTACLALMFIGWFTQTSLMSLGVWSCVVKASWVHSFLYYYCVHLKLRGRARWLVLVSKKKNLAYSRPAMAHYLTLLT